MLKRLWSYFIISLVLITALLYGNPRSAYGQSLTHVATTALLKATVGILGLSVARDGYYVSGDGGAGTYRWSASACTLNSGAGDGGSQIPANAGGCWTLLDVRLNVLAFGAYANFTNPATTTNSFQSWWNACMSPITGVISGNDCFIPAGRYALNATLVWDFVNNPNTGPFIHGAGMANTILDFTGTPGTYLYIYSSGSAPWQKARFENFTVAGANVINGDLAAWQVNDPANALTPSYSVLLNRVTVTNTTNCTPGAKVLSLNNFTNGSINAAIYSFSCPGGS